MSVIAIVYPSDVGEVGLTLSRIVRLAIAVDAVPDLIFFRRCQNAVAVRPSVGVSPDASAAAFANCLEVEFREEDPFLLPGLDNTLS